MTLPTVLAAILLWLLIGDFVAALRPWESDDSDEELWCRIAWPLRVWHVLIRLVREWRTDLYRRTKHH